MLPTEVCQLLKSWLACEEARRTLTGRLFTSRDSAADVQNLLDENDLRIERLVELTREILSRQSTGGQ